MFSSQRSVVCQRISLISGSRDWISQINPFITSKSQQLSSKNTVACTHFLKAPPPRNAARSWSRIRLAPASASSSLLFSLLFIPVGTIPPDCAFLMVGGLVCVRPIIPFFCVYVTIKAPLVAVLPWAPLKAELLPLLVAQIIAAHASMDKASIVRLERSSNRALVMSRCSAAAFVGVTMVEEQLFHLEQLTTRHRHGCVQYPPLQKFCARRFSQRAFVPEKVE